MTLGPAVSNRRAKIEAAASTGRGGVNKIVLATVVALVAIVGTVTGVILTSKSSTPSASGGTATPKHLLEGTRAINAHPEVTPRAGAPLVEVFEDFQCSHCHEFESAVGATFKELGESGQARVGYHVMAFIDEQAKNTASQRAAAGAVCAAEQGTFQAFHDGVFSAPAADPGKGWSDAELEGIAGASGLSGEALSAWRSCVADGRFTAYIEDRTTTPWKDAKIEGTPSVRINGQLVDVRVLATPELLRAAVAAAATSSK